MSAPLSSTIWLARAARDDERVAYARPESGMERINAAMARIGRCLSPLRDYIEVMVVIGTLTVAGWFAPVTYRAFGHVYLLAVIALSMRVSRWPALFAAVVSAVAWNFVFMPPRLSFSVLHVEDSLMLGTYFTVALIAGQLTARIRAQEREERMQKRRATALFDLTRAIAGAQSLDEAVAAALSQAASLFETQCALVLERDGVGRPHPAGQLVLSEREVAISTCAMQRGVPVGRSTLILPSAAALHVPLLRAGKSLGAFVVAPPPGRDAIPGEQRDLIDGFAAQIALLIEREQLRAASEREKLLAESERLHRTLFDSVSHELKTPLAVLRVAGEKLDTDNAGLRATLVREVRTATHRLNRLVGNLLDQNRLESGVLRPQLDWCDARDLINAARRTAGDVLEARELRVVIADDLPCFLADAPLTEHALANLLLNACVHTPADTPILIRAALEEAPGGARICLRVSDRGRGISPAFREQLFQKFCRGEAAKAGGLGLGLSIVRGFMIAQGGDVDCANNPGGGTIFSLYFPYQPHGTVPADER